jgi:hypothetical protein
MNGAYGVPLAAFDRLFAMWPWLALAVGAVALIWIASQWRDDAA